MTIPLDARYSAAKNAQRYFKKYAKSKTAVIEKKVQLEGDRKRDRITSTPCSLLSTTLKKSPDLDDIRAELVENGVLRRRNQERENERNRKFSLMEYFTSSGKRILVGRNNRENDILTFKTASSKRYLDAHEGHSRAPT